RRVVGDDAVARPPDVAVAAAARSIVGAPRRNAGPAPREAAIRRPGHEDAVLVVLPREVDVGVVRGPSAVVDDRGVAAAVNVVTERARTGRERLDAVVPVVAVVSRRV